MIKRDIEKAIRNVFRDLPVVTLVGPKDSGKTTLVKSAFPQLNVVSFDDEPTKQKALSNPEKFLEQFPHGVILDSVHLAAELIPYISKKVNQNDKNSQFILTCRYSESFQNNLKKNFCDKNHIFRLLGMSLAEVNNARKVEASQLDKILVQGFAPITFGKVGRSSEETYKEYMNLLIEHDLKEMIKANSPKEIQKFLAICAKNVGKLVSKEEAFKDLEFSETQIDNWLSALENASVLFRVPPSPINFGKHLSGTVKIFFYDVGFVVWLLNIATPEQLFMHAMREDLFENLIASETIKYRYNRGLKPNLYFYRDARKNEIDLMLEYTEGIFPLIIRSSAVYETHFQSNLELVQSHSFKGSAVILGGGRRQERKQVTIVPWHQYSQFLKEFEL